MEPLVTLEQDQPAFAISGQHIFWMAKKPGFNLQRILKRAPLATPGVVETYATITLDGCPEGFSGAFLMSSGGSLYFPTCNKLYRIDATKDPEQESPEVIATGLQNLALTGNESTTLSNTKIYFLATCSQVLKSCLFEAPLDGNEQTTPTELPAIQGDFIYPAASPTNDLLILTNNGTSGQPSYKTSSQGVPSPFGQSCGGGECVRPFVTSSHLYWESTSNGTSAVYKAQRTNLAAQTLVVDQLIPRTLVVDDKNTAYYVGPKDGETFPLIRKKADGSTQKLSQIDNPGASVAVVGGYLYMLKPITPAQVLRVQVQD